MNINNSTNEMPTRPDDQLDAAITFALERKPSVQIPADFAARIASSLPPAAAYKSPIRRISVARTSALVAAAALTTALFIVAPHVHADHLSLGLGIEMLLLVQLAGVGYGLMRLRENGL